MGWMHDIARVRAQGSGPPPLGAQPDDVLDALHATPRTSSCRSRTTKSCTAKARCSTRCRATCGRSTRRCGRCTATCTAIPGKKLLFMGSGVRPVARVEPRPQPRLAPARRSDARRAAALRAGSQLALSRASRRCTQCDFEPDGFRWIDCNDNENSVVSIVRYARDRDDFVVMVFNFTPVPRAGYRIGVPAAGLLRRAPQQRQRALRRQQRRQRRRRRQRADRRARVRAVAPLMVPPLACLLLKRR